MRRCLIFSLILLSALAAFASPDVNETSEALPSAVKALTEPRLPADARAADPTDATLDDSSLHRRHHRRMHAMMSSATGGVQDNREALSDLQRVEHAHHRHRKQNTHIEMADGTLADMHAIDTNEDVLRVSARHRDASEDFSQQPEQTTPESDHQLPPQTEEEIPSESRYYNDRDNYNTQSGYDNTEENADENNEDYKEAQRAFKEFARFVESRYPEEFSFDRSHHVEDMHLLSDDDLTRELIHAAHMTLASGQGERPTDIHVDDNVMMNVLFRSGVAELEESPDHEHHRHRRHGHESRSKSQSSEHHKHSSSEERERGYTETENENEMSEQEQPQSDDQEMQQMQMQREPRRQRTKHTHTRY